MRSNIPPANRLPDHLARLSSMRASIRTGIGSIGVDVGIGSIRQSAQDKTFTPRIFMPDHQAQRERAARRQAIARLNVQLGLLRDEAASPEEAAIWVQILGKMDR